MEKRNGSIQTKRFDNAGRFFTACNTEMDIPPERHEHFEVVITLKNNFIHTVNGESFIPDVGDVVILRPQDCHSARPLAGEQEHICRDVYIEANLFREACDYISPTLFVSVMSENNPPSFHLSTEELKAFEQSLDFPYPYTIAKNYELYQSVIRIVACNIIGLYVRKSARKEKDIPECLVSMLLLMQGQNRNKIGVAEIAGQVGYSPDYLNRLFKQYFDKSIERYIIESKIYDSLKLLLQTDMPISEIAYEMGWSCTGNYINNFKSVYSVTPARFRKEYSTRSRHGAVISRTERNTEK